MIEIRNREKKKSEQELLVNGHIYRIPKIYIQRTHRKKIFDITVKDDEAAKVIAEHKFSDLPILCRSLSLPIVNHVDFGSGIIGQGVSIYKDNSGQYVVAVRLIFDVENWKHLWSIKEYTDQFKSIISGSETIGMNFSGQDFFVFSLGVSIEGRVKDVEAIIHTEVLKWWGETYEHHEMTEKSLMSKLHSESVVKQFDFPEEVRVPCEQYLLYFAQFLKDLGVEANTALTHEAGQVLFSVTPIDKQQALDKISSALDVYLRLPSNPISDATSEAIAVQRLEANILRLRSDLKLAAAELQAKNATIQAHEITIKVQKGLLSGEIMFESMKDLTQKPEDKEYPTRDTKLIIPRKSKNSETNLNEIFRRLEKNFSEE